MLCVFESDAPGARMWTSSYAGVNPKCSLSMPRYSDVFGCVMNISSEILSSNGEFHRSTATGVVPGLVSLAVMVNSLRASDHLLEVDAIEN